MGAKERLPKGQNCENYKARETVQYSYKTGQKKVLSIRTGSEKWETKKIVDNKETSNNWSDILKEIRGNPNGVSRKNNVPKYDDKDEDEVLDGILRNHFPEIWETPERC